MPTTIFTMGVNVWFLRSCYFKGHIHATSLFKTYCTETVKGPRVRFAPSPTGNLHLGGLRTAFYNYLFARKNRGQFLLRIEDTDRKRIQPNSVDNLKEMLNWIGIVPDESPFKGGNYGPYFQSERLESYHKRANELLEAGFAYRCFCSEDRLDIMRKEALKQRQNPGYDNKCRHLTSSEIQEFLAKRVPFTIRFKLKTGPMTFDDIICGPQNLDLSENEGDFIIVKSDGFPTYHFACVVDDHEMKISHVLRGTEWLLSTPKHIMLHNAFDWTPPKFAHLPLLVNRDRTKLSKRQAALSLQYLKDKKYEPLAIMNFLSRIGTGFDFDHHQNDILELDELCNRFTLSDVGRNSCILELEKLDIYNQRWIMKQLGKDLLSKEIVQKFRLLLKQELGDRYNPDHISDDYALRILNCYQERIHNLRELTSSDMKFLWTSPDMNEVRSSLVALNINSSIMVDCAAVAVKILENIPEHDFMKENLNTGLVDYTSNVKLSRGPSLRILRVLLTGLKDGPPVAEILDLLGKDQSLKKIASVSKELSNLTVNSSDTCEVNVPSC